jgi:uroporphyrinogen III methyltransferase/synthase
VASSALKGKRIVVTRAASQSAKLCEELQQRGAIPISLPLVAIEPPEDFASLDLALKNLRSFDWLIFTSENAVSATSSRLAALHLRLDENAPRHVAVVGPATKEAAEKAGFVVDHAAKTHNAVALAAELRAALQGQTVFLPRSSRANPDLPTALKQYGAAVTDAVAYRTVLPHNIDPAKIDDSLRADAIVFFSPSAVQNFIQLIGPQQFAAFHSTKILAAIGPTTASSLNHAGAHHIVIAADTTVSALADALEIHFAESKAHSTAGAISE